jgi:hypothetical protein
MIEFKGSHFERDVILWGVRWYVAYAISYRQLEEMMDERGVEVDHSTLNLWVLKYVPLLETQFCARKRSVGSSWRLDETYVRLCQKSRRWGGLSNTTLTGDHAASMMQSAMMPRVRKRWRRALVGRFRLRRERGWR